MNKERLSIALSKDTIKRLDDAWRSHKEFRSRSHFIEEAIEQLLSRIDTLEPHRVMPQPGQPILRRAYR